MNLRHLALVGIIAWHGGAEAAVRFAVVEKNIIESYCGSAVLDTVKGWRASKDWYASVGGNPNVRDYRSPTDKVGVWVRLQFLPGKEVVASRITSHTSTTTRWNKATCQAEVQVKTGGKKASVGVNDFTDQELAKLVENRNGGLIYAWSPHMPLSLEGYRDAEKVARKLNLKFVPLLDPNADVQAAKDSQEKAKLSPSALRSIASVDLMLRGIDLHYPNILVFKNGKIYPRILPGLAAAKHVEHFVKETIR